LPEPINPTKPMIILSPVIIYITGFLSACQE